MPIEGFGELVEAARTGNRQALDQLLAAVRPELQRRALRYIALDQPEASASDLVQSVCLRAWQKLEQFECGTDDDQALAQFRAWLFRILHRLGLNQIRHRTAQRRQPEKKHVRLGVLAVDAKEGGGFEPAANQATPSARARSAEEADLVRQALAKVPGEIDRTIVHLRFFKGLALRRIAEQLQLSEDKVRERFYFTLRRLERELGGCL